jgi:DNA-binding response OmpR family regulator
MRKLLIVEDEPILRETYQLILSTQPYLCDVASDGKEALELCKEKSYDLILLDLMMPIMDGVEFLEYYNDLDGVKSKVIVLSNLSSGKEVDRALELGAEKNFVKSDLSPSQLIGLVRYELDARIGQEV